MNQKERFGRRSEEYGQTTNKNLFSKLHKSMLERTGKIRCTLCPYHRHENDGRKHYGSIGLRKEKKQFRYPNWKLVSKNDKQWMGKMYREKIDRYYFDRSEYVEFKF
jgi:hypothetical protein